MSILSIAAAAVLAVHPADVMLAFAPGHCLAPGVERSALAEAAAIWSPYGVVVRRLESGQPPRDGSVVLTVVVSDATAGAEGVWQSALGSVDFDDSGAPGHVVTVFVDRLMQMLESARLWDVPAEKWPRVRREAIMGRAIGRVIAHEIGHVLLRSTMHTARGLMRAIQRADDLVDPARHRYSLSG